MPNQRRAAERQARKLDQEGRSQTYPTSSAPSPQPAAPESIRAGINRANSQHSTGPRTSEGKARSSQNSFKHGLYSKQLVLASEDPAELEQLRASLRAEHQPANTTEEILVNEIAENFWRLRRMRQLEARTLEPENVSDLDNMLAMIKLIQRTMASAERAFHKSLAVLRQLQKDRGFVPQIISEVQSGFVPLTDTPIQCPERSEGFHTASENGFVSQNGQNPLADTA